MGKYTVTFEEYDNYCDDERIKKPKDCGWGRGRKPVIKISWLDAVKYCNWLSKKEGFINAYDDDGNLLNTLGIRTDEILEVEGYRLPTEAEWEYAARGGEKSLGYKYSGGDDLDSVAWYEGNSGEEEIYYEKTGWFQTNVKTRYINQKTHEVGLKKPNELGIYDMNGNIWEWCQDWYDPEFFKKNIGDNPVNLIQVSERRVTRGGHYDSSDYLSISSRDYTVYDGTRKYLGFRVVRTNK